MKVTNTKTALIASAITIRSTQVFATITRVAPTAGMSNQAVYDLALDKLS